MKGQIPLVEVIVVSIVLFASFAIFFPGKVINNGWQDADVVLKGRDLMVTMDRIDKVHSFLSNPTEFADFMNRAVPERNFIYSLSVDGTVQPVVTVACNCTTDEIKNLLNWIGRVKLNGRDIQVDVIPTTLSPIQDSDVLVIWGKRDYFDEFPQMETDILNYIKAGNGVVAMANFTQTDGPDATYTKIFGIVNCENLPPPPAVPPGQCKNAGGTTIDFSQPNDASDENYYAYKFFKNMPIRSIVPQDTPPVPILVEPGTPACSEDGYPITFMLRDSKINYWTCPSSGTAYFDTNDVIGADKIVSDLDDFTIAGEEVSMRYVELNRTFISLGDYSFQDVTDQDEKKTRVYPVDGDTGKILLYNGEYQPGKKIPVATVNGSASNMAIWTLDFYSGTEVSHDKRLLLQSLILAASNKINKGASFGNLKIGSLTSYVNIANRDMFEPYKINLALGFPF